MSKRQGVLVGLTYYVKFLAEWVNECSSHWRRRTFGNSRAGTLRAMLALRRADALICFGGPAPDAVLVEAARSANVPIFVIWGRK